MSVQRAACNCDSTQNAPTQSGVGAFILLFLVRLAGVEPATFWSATKRSIH